MVALGDVTRIPTSDWLLTTLLQHYYILLILTDGQFTDIYDCIAAIVEASDYPMSIIIGQLTISLLTKS